METETEILFIALKKITESIKTDKSYFFYFEISSDVFENFLDVVEDKLFKFKFTFGLKLRKLQEISEVLQSCSY